MCNLLPLSYAPLFAINGGMWEYLTRKHNLSFAEPERITLEIQQLKYYKLTELLLQINGTLITCSEEPTKQNK